MTVEYNPFELLPVPRFFNFDKYEFETFHDSESHSLTYDDLVMNTSPHVHWLIFSDRMDYSGDQMALGIDADDNLYLSTYGYGSCEMCDPIMSCETKEEVIETFEDIRRGIVKASTFEEMSEVIKNKIMSDHISMVDWIGFLVNINEKFKGEMNIVLDALKPDERLMMKIYEENVETLDDFFKVTTTLCKVFPSFNFLKMDMYPQWVHAYLLITNADELNTGILQEHKQRFQHDSFQLNFEEFRDSMLAGKLAEILNECPDVILAISSTDLTEYTIYSTSTENIDDELFSKVKLLIYEKLNLNKFYSGYYLFYQFEKQKQQQFHFHKSDHFYPLKQIETNYSIRRDKYSKFSVLEIESFHENENILMVRKQKDICLSNKRTFPPMKFTVGEKVEFSFKDQKVIGTIEIADFGGSLEHDYHSYDILSEDNCLYKHIPEKAIERYLKIEKK